MTSKGFSARALEARGSFDPLFRLSPHTGTRRDQASGCLVNPRVPVNYNGTFAKRL